MENDDTSRAIRTLVSQNTGRLLKSLAHMLSEIGQDTLDESQAHYLGSAQETLQFCQQLHTAELAHEPDTKRDGQLTVETLLREIRSYCLGLADSHSVQLSIQSEPDVPAVLRVDSKLLRLLLVSLLTRAIEQSASDQVVSLYLSHTEQEKTHWIRFSCSYISAHSLEHSQEDGDQYQSLLSMLGRAIGTDIRYRSDAEESHVHFLISCDECVSSQET